MKQVIIYSKNGCGPCQMMKTWFEENGVEYEERNISTSDTYMQELQYLGFQSVPITLVNGEVKANGFEPWKLEDVLK